MTSEMFALGVFALISYVLYRFVLALVHHLGLNLPSFARKELRLSEGYAEITTEVLRRSPAPRIYTSKEILEGFSRDSWQLHAYEAFAEKLGDRDRIFPCIYATKGLRGGDLAFLFLEYEDPTTSQAIRDYARAILAYDETSQLRGDNTSLVVLYPEAAKRYTLEEYHFQFWALLKGLKILDQKPWPNHVNENTDSPYWAMCFDGKMSFWAVLTPAHSRRRSRYLPNLAIVYQPRWIFEKLLSTDAKRKAALDTVRGLIDKYDNPLPRSPDLGNFGQAGKSEAYQYFSMDENVTQPCPYQKL